MIKNLKVYFDEKKYGAKLVLVTVSMAIGLTALTGCTTNNKDIYESLDPSKVETATTTYEDRVKYYDENVDDIFHNLPDEEVPKYYVSVDIEYIGRENISNDELIFLRNDGTYLGDVQNGMTNNILPPGVYKIISSGSDDENRNFGEITILTPGEHVTMIVDFNNHTVELNRETKEKTR